MNFKGDNTKMNSYSNGTGNSIGPVAIDVAKIKEIDAGRGKYVDLFSSPLNWLRLITIFTLTSSAVISSSSSVEWICSSSHV